MKSELIKGLNEKAFDALRFRVGARRRFLARFFGSVDRGMTLDLEDIWKQARRHRLHTLGMAVVALLTPIAVRGFSGILGLDIFSSGTFRAGYFVLCVLAVVWVLIFLERAAELSFKQKDFKKHMAIEGEGLQKIMKGWAVQNPTLQHFLEVNNLLSSYSMFEFELVQTYFFRKQSGSGCSQDA